MIREFAEWRCIELLSMIYNPRILLDWQDRTGENQVTSSEPVDKLPLTPS